MNTYQHRRLLVGALMIAAVMGMVPPWQYVTSQGALERREHAGYRPVPWPPPNVFRTIEFSTVQDAIIAEKIRESDPDTYQRLFQREYSAQVDFLRLALQWFVVAILFTAASFGGPVRIAWSRLRRVGAWGSIGALIAAAWFILQDLTTTSEAAFQDRDIMLLGAIALVSIWPVLILMNRHVPLTNVVAIAAAVRGTLDLLARVAQTGVTDLQTGGGFGFAAVSWTYAYALFKRKSFAVSLSWIMLVLLGLGSSTNLDALIWGLFLWFTLYLRKHPDFRATRSNETGTAQDHLADIDKKDAEFDSRLNWTVHQIAAGQSLEVITRDLIALGLDPDSAKALVEVALCANAPSKAGLKA